MSSSFALTIILTYIYSPPSSPVLQLCDWLKDKLGSVNKELTKVDLSSRLTSSPAALVQGAYGMSPTMQRYMRAQVRERERSGYIYTLHVEILEVNREREKCSLPPPTHTHTWHTPFFDRISFTHIYI
jgi:hypothetical protein